MILTLSEVKTWLGVTDNASDSILTVMIPLVESSIANMLDIQLEQTTITNEVIHYNFSRFDTSGSTGLSTFESKGLVRLKRSPVITITNISYNSTPIEASDYFFINDLGLVQFLRLHPDLDFKLTCTYVAGYTDSTLPPDLKLLLLDGVKSMFRNSGKALQNQGNIKSKRIGDFAVTYGIDDTGYLATHSYTIKKYSNFYI